MTLIIPKDGARLGLDDPLCRVKTTEMLTTCASTEMSGFEGRTHELYNHCERREELVPQAEDKPSRK